MPTPQQGSPITPRREPSLFSSLHVQAARKERELGRPLTDEEFDLHFGERAFRLLQSWATDAADRGLFDN